MTPAWDEKEVFLAALDLKPEEREAFLLKACPDDAARERIRRLLLWPDKETIGLPTPPAASAITPDPVRIDEFVIQRRLGAGGMGVVYLAHDTVLGRQVAIKVLAKELIDSETSVARFREEARHAAALKHPGIVAVYKFGFDGARHYIVSEYVDGTTLGALIDAEQERRRPQPSTSVVKQWHRQCAELLAATAEALDYSHRAGIIHRDIKPANILVDKQGTPRLTDFGIAMQATEKTQTQTEMLGSCYYMSPEQAAIAQTKIDRRSDIFSLGVVMYEMLALRRPFEGRDVNQILRAVVSAPAPRLHSIDRLIPKDLETICEKAMEKDRAARYQTAGLMAADLRCFLAGEPIPTRPIGTIRRSVRTLRRHRTSVAIATCVVLALTVVGLTRLNEERRREALAWISVRADSNSQVFAQRVDESTLRLAHESTRLGAGSSRSWQLPPGLYRITVVASDDSRFAEFDVALRQVGRAHRAVLTVADAWNETDVPSADRDVAASDRYFARHRPLSEVTAADAVVHIKAGEYPFGCDKDGPNVLTRLGTGPIDSFYIDRHETSNREYLAFVQATKRPVSPPLEAMLNDPQLLDLPVVNLTGADAAAYARWVGKRLPTMHEWQAAACTTRGFRYPWGDHPILLKYIPPPTNLLQSIQAAGKGDPRADFYRAYMTSVTTKVPGSPALLHTFGNALEMTSTIHGDDVVIAGPHLFLSPLEWDLRRVTTTPPQGYDPIFGFRCAKSAKPPGLSARH